MIITHEELNKLENLVSSIYFCHCDTSLEKETGDLPPDTNNKNWYGESVWANEICNICQLKFLTQQLKSK